MALVTPALVMSAGLAIEISHWTVVKLELQRTADLAALAGATEYASTSDDGKAANAAASIAELNGAAGSATRTWNTSTRLLSDNKITAQVMNGIRNSQNTGIKVTVSQTVPLALTQVMSTLPSVTVSATSWAEFRVKSQPCLLALRIGGTGISTQGNPAITLTECSIRSNASISTGGSSSMSASAFYAKDSITGITAGGRLYPNSSTAPDPYAEDALVQAAFTHLGTSPKKELRVQPNDSMVTLSPGTWSKWDIKGPVTLSPGIYYVNGDISVTSSNASLAGTGVTIVTSGVFDANGGSITLTAAEIGSNVNGAIPGVVFAGNSTSSSSFLGNTNPLLTGVVYYPNGGLKFGGTAQGGSKGCLEVVAASIEMHGNSQLASKCSKYRASSPGAAAIALVQ